MAFIILQQPPSLMSAGSAVACWPRASHLAGADLLGRRSRPRRRATMSSQVHSRTSDAICTENVKLPREGTFFEMEMAARDCDLDKYGAISSAAYAVYMETARQEMLASLGICTGSIARAGRALAISELNVKYVAPLKPGAKFVVMVRIVQIKGVRMLMEHLIATLPDRELVLEAMGTVVCLNKDYRPTRMFPEMANLLNFFCHPN
ncbi:unnamed protein product [Urochloa decumbens]|uniref:Thioesterase domain-containing protein n=1 Tax=Urochloa decumbens TaxID=240449 RepID=A0ABC8V956_9POAL